MTLVNPPPYQYIVPAGVVVPDTSSILQDVITEYQSVFGQDLNTDPSTPQGVLITAEALARAQVVNNNAALANEINPNLAGGIFLDAICALMRIPRGPQSQTIVTNATLTGEFGTVIPQGAQARTESGDIFSLTSNITIPVGGTALGIFQANQAGPIPCTDSTLTIILTGVVGWETVNNDQSGDPASTTTLGVSIQSDQALRAFRNNTLAFQAVSLAEAITSALYAVEGVQSLFFQENISDSSQTINGIAMVSHSVYVCVNGGTDTDIAAALLENKSSGAAWNGGTSVPVIEPASGQTYTVLFDRPSTINIYIKVTTTNGNESQIVQSILDYAAGLIELQNQNGTTQTLPGFVVGSDVSPFDISGAIMSENPGIYLSNVQLSIDGTTFNNTPVAIAVDQIAFTQSSYISVVVT